MYFEDLRVGDIDEFGRYEVTEAEIVEFAGKYDPQPYHLDKEAAKSSMFGELVASGWHTCSMAMRMFVDNMDANVTSEASPGVSEVRWIRPVIPGDVLSLRAEVIKARPSRSRPGLGIVHQKLTALDAHGEPVMSMNTIAFYQRRKSA